MLKRVEFVVIIVSQYLIRTLGRVFMFFMARIEVVGKYNAESSGRPILVISNHKSYYDPLVIACSFPLFSKVYPLRFIAWDKFFQKFFSRMAFRAMGSYPACYGQGIEKSLMMPGKILEEKGSVVFFAEGSCFRDDQLHPLKPGAAILALRHPDVWILPVAVSGSYRIGRPFRRPAVRFSIGEPFQLMSVTSANTTPEELNRIFTEKIEEVYDKAFHPVREKEKVYQI